MKTQNHIVSIQDKAIRHTMSKENEAISVFRTHRACVRRCLLCHRDAYGNYVPSEPYTLRRKSTLQRWTCPSSALIFES